MAKGKSKPTKPVKRVKKRMGRPLLPAGQKRSVEQRVQIRLTAAERDTLRTRRLRRGRR